MHVIAFINIAISAAEMVIMGGLLESGVNSVWGLVALIGALAVFGDRRANLWLAFYIVVNVVAAIIASRVEPIESLPPGRLHRVVQPARSRGLRLRCSVLLRPSTGDPVGPVGFACGTCCPTRSPTG